VRYALQVHSARLAVMDERAIKRLVIILAASLAAIFAIKSVMYRTIVGLNRIAAEKKQTGARPAASTPSDAATNVELTPASAADEVAPVEQLPASGVGEAR
jgi:hypothetical protein